MGKVRQMRIELIAYKVTKKEVYRHVYPTKYDDWHDAYEMMVKELKAKDIEFDEITVSKWIFPKET